MANIREKVSGIGSMSERTDLNVSQQPARYISGMPYGQGQATYNQQTAAPMAAVGEAPMLPEVTSLLAPTQRPNEPITSGVDFGPGANSNAIQLPNQEPTALAILRQIAMNDPSGETELIFQTFLERGIG